MSLFKDLIIYNYIIMDTIKSDTVEINDYIENEIKEKKTRVKRTTTTPQEKNKQYYEKFKQKCEPYYCQECNETMSYYSKSRHQIKRHNKIKKIKVQATSSSNPDSQ